MTETEPIVEPDTEDPEFPLLTIDVPAQGLRVDLYTTQEAIDWFKNEINFLELVQAKLAGAIVLSSGKFNIDVPKFTEHHEEVLAILVINPVDTKKLREFVSRYNDDANIFKTFVSSGYLGNHLRQLAQANNDQEIKRLVAMLFHGNIGSFDSRLADMMWIVRGALLWHPAFENFHLIASSQQAVDTARNSQKEIEHARAGLNLDLQRWEGRIAELERKYEEQIRLKAPAQYWNEKAKKHRNAAVVAFIAFAAIIGVAIVLGWMFRSDVMAFVSDTTPTGSDKTTVNTTSSFLRSLSVIMIPTLAIAWVLRHVSRIFVQNFTQRHDALNREMLAYTYLSIAEDKDMQLGENERALILNALFRPAPPHTGDEGPPMGLIDLIKSK